MTVEGVFLDYSARKLRQLSGRIADCLGRLDDAQVWARPSGGGNAVGNLVLHLCGNVRQWIVAGVGGAADERVRDLEFLTAGGVAASELAARLNGTVEEACRVLEGLPAERLAARVSIQGYDVTVLECVYHVVEHFSGHAGQIVFAVKAVTGADLNYYGHLAGAHGERTP